MPDKTRRELVVETLDVLGLLAAGQDPAPEDFATIDERVGPVLARLNKLGITYVGDPEHVPEAEFLDLAVLLADAVKQRFGMAALPQNDPGVAEANLLAMNASKSTREQLQVDYF